MVAGFQITSILLICFLSEVNYSSAFPRARSLYPAAWQGVRKTSQEKHAHWIHRPLQYFRALRQAKRELQPNVHGQDPIITTRPGLYHQTQSPYLTQPDVANKLIQKLSPPQKNHLQPKPRSFEFSLRLPFANLPDQNKETSSITRGGKNDGLGDSQLYRPTSVQIQSSFNRPFGSDGFSDKGSTNNPDGGKNTHDSKPSFQLSFSVPIPSRTPPTKHTSSNLGYFENVQKPGSVTVQSNNMEPAISTLSHESTPSVHYYGSQLKPGGKNYEQGQTGQPTDSQHTIASEQYNYGHFKPSFGYGQNGETVSNPGSPTIPSLQYEPSFGYPNGKVVTTKNYDGKDNMLLTGQIDFSSSSPDNYNKAQGGQALLPDHPTAFDNLPNFQHLSTEYQAHVGLPGQSTDGFQQDGKPSYTKRIIDAAPVAYYDPYSVGWTGQNTAVPPVENPSPLSTEPQSHFVGHQSTGFEYEQKGTEKHDTTFETHPSTKPEWYMPVYDQTPLKDGEGEQHAYNPQKQNAVFVTTNFDQQQYPIGQMKPTSDQSVVTQNPASVNRIDYSNIYVSIISQNPSGSTSSEVQQHAKPWGKSNSN